MAVSRNPAMFAWQPGPAGHGFIVTENGTALRTPKGHIFTVPSADLAAAIAAELREAELREVGFKKSGFKPNGGKFTDRQAHLTKLALTALDLVAGGDRDQIVTQLADKIQFDSILYQATHPPRLVAAQHRHWQPVIDQLSGFFARPILVTTAMTALPQNPDLTAKIADWLRRQSPHDLVVVGNLVEHSGSLALAMAAVLGWITTAQLVEASLLVEQLHLQIWGEDDEARARLSEIQLEIETVMRFRELCH
ncbi:MAG: ATP12 family protein [Candidatus Symbiobacter sp.]|nr:ATP12 family protein [Candidatus Symbiobacter sp.]